MRELMGDSARGTDFALVRLRVDGGRIVDADADGLTQDLRGLSLLEAAAVGGETLPVDALANALGPVVRAGADSDRVAVAMSGGVDSAVALLAAGAGAVGVTLRLWIDPEGPDVERACCSPEAVLAARRTCHERGLPHVTLDLRDAFRRAVVEPFVRGYARGETPNPCTRCNGGFRFAQLLAFTRRIGAARLATGHYARVVRHEGRLLLARGADPDKDQSYMLARVPEQILSRTWFPLGDQRKTETREQARAAGLAAAGRRESQEVCFVGGGDHRRFLERHGGAGRAGAVVTVDGRVIGRHDGVHRFTPGQRKGLGVGGGEALFVLEVDPARGRVVAGPRRALARSTVTVRPGTMVLPMGRVQAKLRYRSPALPATVREVEGGLELELDEPAYGVAPGQAAVLYDGDVIVGGGVIAG